MFLFFCQRKQDNNRTNLQESIRFGRVRVRVVSVLVQALRRGEMVSTKPRGTRENHLIDNHMREASTEHNHTIIQ